MKYIIILNKFTNTGHQLQVLSEKLKTCFTENDKSIQKMPLQNVETYKSHHAG